MYTVTVLVAVLCLPVSAISHRQAILGVTPVTKSQVDILLRAQSDPQLDVEFLPHPALHQHTEVLTSANVSQHLRQLWQEAHMAVTVLVSDVAEWVKQADEYSRGKRDSVVPTAGPRDITLNITLNHHFYRHYDQIISDIKVLVDKFGPELIRFDESGNTPPRPLTVEGRILHVVELGKQHKGKEKQVIMIEANIHAREWIAAAANLYMMDWLVTNYAHDVCVQRLLDTYTVVVVPVANPDGYEYTWHNNSQRLWRKNRRVYDSCVGVDLNRNFDFQWGNARPCSSGIYPGPTANSEPETQALARIFQHCQREVVLYLAVHSYAQLVLLPWAHNSSLVDHVHKRMGNLLAEAMTKEGRDYGQAKTVKDAFGYTAKGSSTDWVLSQKLTNATEDDAKLISLTIEMRPSISAGGHFQGFLLPPRHIIPAGREYTAGILAAALNYEWVVKP